MSERAGRRAEAWPSGPAPEAPRAETLTVDALHSLTLGDVLAQHRRSHPRRTAVVCGNHRATWPELDDRVARLAGALDAQGVRPGERVLWLGQNCHRVLELLLACARVGAALCPANWCQTPEELAFVVDDCAPRVVVWQDTEIGDAVRAAHDLATRAGDACWVRHDTAPDDPEGYETLLASALPLPERGVDPSSPVLVLYTGAFGGRPNGALLSHAAITAQDMVIANVARVTCDDVFLNSGPLFHIATFWSTLTTFHMGGTNVFVRRVDAEELCRLIDVERCTGAFVLPPTRDEMLEANRDHRYDLSSLRAAPGPPEWNAMVTVDTSPWWTRPGGYGQTEVVGMVTFNCLGGDALGTHGRPSPLAQVRLFDEDDREVPPGEVGEIVVRGPQVMTGYHDRAELDAQRQRDGWHHTGDLGRVEADGSITFIGPKARMLKSAAENIYPAEVERCLAGHPAVREAAVIGVPDPVWTQSVKAVVALHDGAAITADDLIEHCRAHIASYKKPRTVEFVDALPRTGFAVDYDALDRRYGGGGYPGGSNRSA
ncbi:MAG TPA: AMP-binding protein [Acidimicrobiia bacterium]|nr:AMP-binding protein [Acidimicrobiia bacterium]